LQVSAGIRGNASEDFACLAAMVPSAYFFLSAGFEDERGDAVAHHPRVLFHEDALPMGAAALAHCAIRWLEESAPGN
jgi:metal-dependent amidase/aminoacylase/carboxypeptidase family protein